MNMSRSIEIDLMLTHFLYWFCMFLGLCAYNAEAG